MRETYEFLEFLLEVIQRTEVSVDVLQPLLKLLVQGRHPPLTFLLDLFLPEHGELLDLSDHLVPLLLFLLDELVEVLTKMTSRTENMMGFYLYLDNLLRLGAEDFQTSLGSVVAVALDLLRHCRSWMVFSETTAKSQFKIETFQIKISLSFAEREHTTRGAKMMKFFLKVGHSV